MPSFATASLPKPKSWDEFEDIVADILKVAWNDPFPTRNGRLGQKQHGVDIYGKPVHSTSYSGAQCKLSAISLSDIKEEITSAEGFQPPLKELIIAIASNRDALIQEKIRIIDQERTSKGKFSVKILFWEDIQLILAESEDLMVKHFPQFVNKNSSLDNIQKRIMGSEVDDWVISEDQKTYTYKKDANLFIKAEPLEQSQKFEEEWLKSFPDQHGSTDHYLIFYGNSQIDKLWAVSVDGDRCTIPYPHGATMSIKPYQYKLGKIINGLIYGRTLRFNTFDDYLRRAGISVEIT